MSCSVEGSLSFSLWAFRGDVPGLGTPHRTHSPHSARTHPTQTHAHHKQPQTQPRKQLPPGEIFKRNQAAPFWVCSVPPARWHRAFSGCLPPHACLCLTPLQSAATLPIKGEESHSGGGRVGLAETWASGCGHRGMFKGCSEPPRLPREVTLGRASQGPSKIQGLH